MFDDVHFTGTVNLGNLVNALVVLIGAAGLYFRIKAELADHERKTGQKIETSLTRRLIKPKAKKPSSGPTPTGLDNEPDKDTGNP